jgi:hypothetical protein
MKQEPRKATMQEKTLNWCVKGSIPERVNQNSAA